MFGHADGVELTHESGHVWVQVDEVRCILGMNDIWGVSGRLLLGGLWLVDVGKLMFRSVWKEAVNFWVIWQLLIRIINGSIINRACYAPVQHYCIYIRIDYLSDESMRTEGDKRVPEYI